MQVTHQLPNELASYMQLLHDIQYNDPEICAAVSMANNYSLLHGKMNDSEETTTYILPSDQVFKKIKARIKRTQAKIFNMIKDT